MGFRCQVSGVRIQRSDDRNWNSEGGMGNAECGKKEFYLIYKKRNERSDTIFRYSAVLRFAVFRPSTLYPIP